MRAETGEPRVALSVSSAFAADWPWIWTEKGQHLRSEGLVAHFYSHYTINERSDGLVAMSMVDGKLLIRGQKELKVLHVVMN